MAHHSIQETEALIRKYHARGWSQRRISETLYLGRSTIYAYFLRLGLTDHQEDIFAASTRRSAPASLTKMQKPRAKKKQGILTPKLARFIAEDRIDGVSIAELASRYCVSQQIVRQALHISKKTP